MKTLGVIGGMGPQASIRFLELVIQRCIKEFGVVDNNEFPHILLSNLPAPDIIANRENEGEARRMLAEEGRKLEGAGVDFLVMTCNSMHILSDSCTNAVSIPFLSIIDTVVNKALTEERKSVGLLGTMTTMTSDLYMAPLQDAGIEVVIPPSQERERVVRCILNVIAGRASDKDVQALQEIIRGLQEGSAEAVILGCTELPLLINQSLSEIPVLDSLELLAEASCEEIFR